MTTDTIYALSTPPGKSGVAVIRVSGPKALESLDALSGTGEPPPRISKLYALTDPGDGALIDHAVAIYYAGPKSFTGEDVVEFQTHGSLAVIQSLLSALTALPGLRPAEPGEFTRRAFENGKLDLTEAEAINDLIHAETTAQRDQALSQMSGALSNLYHGWAEELTKALAYVEAVIDFPDEEVPDEETSKARPAIKKIATAIADHLNDNRRGERLRHGIQVAVIGAPNAGKSSLVNALAQRDVAIVSDIAGTTRDVIDVHLDLAGYPVLLSDTAGLRPDQLSTNAQDTIESEGIRRALERANESDIRLLLFDGSADTLDEHTAALIDENAIIVMNKSDLSVIPSEVEGSFLEQLKQISPCASLSRDDMISISVQTGDNISALIKRITAQVEKLLSSAREAPSLTRARHRSALEECHQNLQTALSEQTPELIAESLRLALRHLGRITGRVDVEDLLDVIFRDFCIGK